MNKGAHSSKRKQFDIKFKRDLIEEFDKLQSKGKVNKSLFSLNHGITTSTFTTILLQREKLCKATKKGIVGNAKRLRVCPYQQLNNAMMIWFKQLSAMKCPVSGPILQQKAKQFADQIGIADFILQQDMSEHLNSLYEAALHKVAEKPKQLKISDMFRK